MIKFLFLFADTFLSVCFCVGLSLIVCVSLHSFSLSLSHTHIHTYFVVVVVVVVIGIVVWLEYFKANPWLYIISLVSTLRCYLTDKNSFEKHNHNPMITANKTSNNSLLLSNTQLTFLFPSLSKCFLQSVCSNYNPTILHLVDVLKFLLIYNSYLSFFNTIHLLKKLYHLSFVGYMIDFIEWKFH